MNLGRSDLLPLLTLIVVCIGTGVAIWRMSEWKTSMKAKAAYDLAKRLLRQLFEIRDAIDFVRTDRLHEADVRAFKRQNPGEPIAYEDPTLEAALREAGNRETWPRLSQALAPYKSDLLEAEALWGKEVSLKLKRVVAKVDDLWYANQDYIDALLPPHDGMTAAEAAQRRLELNKIVYLQPPVREDSYKKEVEEIVTETADHLRKYLSV